MNQKRVLQIVACFICLALFSCRSTRITRATFPSDTTARPNPDSADREKQHALATSIIEKMHANHITFQTFSAELKMDYEDDKGKKMNNLSVNIRMQYDSAIWIRVSQLNIEGARILITKDSIKVVNRLENTVTLRSAAEGKELMKMDMDFTMLQDMIIGNPVFLSDSINNIIITPSVISFAAIQQNITTLFNVFADDYVLQECKMTQQVNADQTRIAELKYGDRRNVDNHKFAFQRSIYVEDKNVVKVALDFKKAEFNKPQTFPFPIPARFKHE